RAGDTRGTSHARRRSRLRRARAAAASVHASAAYCVSSAPSQIWDTTSEPRGKWSSCLPDWSLRESASTNLCRLCVVPGGRRCVGAKSLLPREVAALALEELVVGAAEVDHLRSFAWSLRTELDDAVRELGNDVA